MEGVLSQHLRSAHFNPKCFSHFCPFFDVSWFIIVFVLAIFIIEIPASTTLPSVLLTNRRPFYLQIISSITLSPLLAINFVSILHYISRSNAAVFYLVSLEASSLAFQSVVLMDGRVIFSQEWPRIGSAALRQYHSSPSFSHFLFCE